MSWSKRYYSREQFDSDTTKPEYASDAQFAAARAGAKAILDAGVIAEEKADEGHSAGQLEEHQKSQNAIGQPVDQAFQPEPQARINITLFGHVGGSAESVGASVSRA